MALVEYKTNLSVPRRGLCSSWLERLPVGRCIPTSRADERLSSSVEDQPADIDPSQARDTGDPRRTGNRGRTDESVLGGEM